jgi:hypothetical protein
MFCGRESQTFLFPSSFAFFLMPLGGGVEFMGLKRGKKLDPFFIQA